MRAFFFQEDGIRAASQECCRVRCGSTTFHKDLTHLVFVIFMSVFSVAVFLPQRTSFPLLIKVVDMFSSKSMLITGLVSLIAASYGHSVDAGHRHKRSRGYSYYGETYAPVPYSDYGVSGSGVPNGQARLENTSQRYGRNYSPYGLQMVPSDSQPRVVIPAPVPPPGTIGRTYRLPSRPVPVEKHPRVGMIDVKVMDANQVIVHDMNAMRTEDTIDGFRDAKDPNIWHFESKPLYPGLDHVYRVQANFKKADGTETSSERYVRLIMGRVVELKFSTDYSALIKITD